jgi:hypothetical protein
VVDEDEKALSAGKTKKDGGMKGGEKGRKSEYQNLKI